MSKTIRKIMPAVILAAGIIMMISGIYRGELRVILQKGIVICLECIGIG